MVVLLHGCFLECTVTHIVGGLFFLSNIFKFALKHGASSSYHTVPLCFTFSEVVAQCVHWSAPHLLAFVVFADWIMNHQPGAKQALCLS